MTKGMDGGKIGPMVAEAAVMAQLNSGSYPSSFIAWISIFPRPAASAMADPVIPLKIREARTLTWPSAPRIRPVSPPANLKIMSVTLPLFMTLAVNMKSGTAMMT